MTSLAWTPKPVEIPGSELEYVGPYGRVTVRQMPLITVGTGWYEDLRVVARNGRRRNLVTIPGHGAGIKPASAGKTYPPDPLTTEEMLKLLDVIPQDTRTGVRNRALLAVLWRTGLRVSEGLDLLPHHVDFDSKRVTVLRGKGSKRRTVGIDSYGLFALQPWLFERMTLCIPNNVPLFCTTQLPGRGGRVYSAYVRSCLHSYARLAGIPKRVHPHGLRHALAVGLIREGFSLAHVSAQLGHADLATTCIYLRSLGSDEAFDAIAGREWPGLAPVPERFTASPENMALLPYVDDPDADERWSLPNAVADRAGVQRRGITPKLVQLERARLVERRPVEGARPAHCWRTKELAA